MLFVKSKGWRGNLVIEHIPLPPPPQSPVPASPPASLSLEFIDPENTYERLESYDQIIAQNTQRENKTHTRFRSFFLRAAPMLRSAARSLIYYNRGPSSVLRPRDLIQETL